MIKQTLTQKMMQKLSPQQIQLMKLLQVPTASLEQRIKEELESNPALDEGSANESDDLADQGEEGQEEVFELDDYLYEYMEDDPSSYRQARSSDEEYTDRPIVVEDTYQEYLLMQLSMVEGIDDRSILVAKQIIGSIDSDGYLRRDAESISDDLLFMQNLDISPSEVESALKIIQRLDPPGTGARDLRECLLLQLEKRIDLLKKRNETPDPALNLARVIISEWFEIFSKKHYEKILRNLDISEQELRDAMTEILKCNPKPASGYSTASAGRSQYVIPDFIIYNRDGELELTLNSRNAPDLKVNDQYREMLKAYSERSPKQKASKKKNEAIVFIKQKIDSARWFIDAIRQRQDTMYRAMYAILQYQYDYFLTGDDRRLKPMILKDVADLTGLDISTVSRVANSKYVQTEFGTKRLKDFFSEAMQTTEGKEVSSLEIKDFLSEIVDTEDKRKPFSDEKLKNLLTEKGYDIARRTVAKYREQLGIPVARLRKEL